MSLFHLEKVFKTYGKDTALRGIDLDIEEGEFLAIVGPSGCGKSTLLRILSFLEEKTSGIYLFQGKKAESLSTKEIDRLHREDFAFVFQDYLLEDRLSAFENVAIPLYIRGGKTKKETEREVLDALKRTGTEDLRQKKAKDLSGGEKQRIAIARALVTKPKILFADEPCGNLDVKNGLGIMNLFQELHKEGVTIIMVTHNLDHAKMGKRIVSMRDGRVVCHD